ncbi:MAG: glycosyltransferase family 4 protein [Gammaproteobacteria bacterium]|nr:glycosyltransferase family 4 protein [Gammaproteobacteria bacterium]
MRILHVETGRHLYGGARQALWLAEALAGHGCESVFVCTRGSEVAMAAAGRVETWPLRWQGEADLLALPRLLSAVRRFRPDLLHAHGRRGADLYTAGAAAWTGVPALVTRRVDRPERGRLARWKYRQYRRVGVLSRAIAAALEAGVGAALPPRVLIPSAVDTAHYRPDDGARARLASAFELPDGAPVIAMAAQLIPRKGHALLLEALPRVWASHPTLTCLLFGRGAGHAALAGEIAAQGWTERVRLVGWRADLAALLPAIDVLAHPALAEGLGLILLEAGACGVPVVACAAGGIPEVVVDGETGLLVPPGDAPALAGALLRILDDRTLARSLGAAARRRVATRFSIPAMAESYARLYRDILEEAAAP